MMMTKIEKKARDFANIGFEHPEEVAEVKTDILQCKVKSVLDKYHNLDLDRLPIANALYSLSKIAEEMAEILEEKFA